MAEITAGVRGLHLGGHAGTDLRQEVKVSQEEVKILQEERFIILSVEVWFTLPQGQISS